MSQCTGTAKKTGAQCKAAALKDGELCAGHAGLGIAADPTSYASEGARATNAMKRDRAEARRKSALDWAAEKLEKNGEVLAQSVIDAANKGDWRAAAFLYERVYGKPTERVETAAVNVDEMSAAQRTQLRAEIAEQYPHLRAVGE